VSEFNNLQTRYLDDKPTKEENNMNRMRLILNICVIFSVLLPAVAIGGETSKAQKQVSALLGCWQCQKGGALAALIFHSPNLLSQDDRYYKYKLIPGAVRVYDGYEFADYYYKTNGRQFAALYPDGSQIYCERSDCASLVTKGGQSAGRSSGGQGYNSSNNQIEMPTFGGGSWETPGSQQYHNDSGGYGGGAYENPSSNYYNE
jgi:hypothetical protein